MNRHALLILCLVVAVDSASFGLLLPVLPFFVGDLIGNFNAIAITQVTAVYAGCQLVGAPLIGRWSDRLGRKPLLASSIGIGSLALLGAGLASNLPILMVFLGLKGASSGVFALAQAVVADSVNEAKERTVSYGALGASLGLGFVAGPAVGGIIGAMNPRAPFLLAAGFTLINLILVLTVLKESRKVEHRSAANKEPLKFWSKSRGKLRRLLTVYFLFYLGFSAFTGIFVLDVRDRFNWGPQGAGWVLFFVGVVAAVVQGGFLPKLLVHFRAGRLAGFGLILVAIAILGVASIKVGNQLYVTQFLFATGVGLSTPGLRSLLSQTVSSSQQGILGGLTQSAISLTELFGPLMAGRLYVHAGYQTTYQVQAALVLLAAGMLIASPNKLLDTETPEIQAVKTPSP
jgi:MFS family permease